MAAESADSLRRRKAGNSDVDGGRPAVDDSQTHRRRRGKRRGGALVRLLCCCCPRGARECVLLFALLVLVVAVLQGGQLPSVEQLVAEAHSQQVRLVKEELLARVAGPPVRRPGQLLAEAGAGVKHGVVMLPGITSTGLEVWQAQDCAASFFRQRLWGTSLMLSQLLLQPRCWLSHLVLSLETGLDPVGIRLRAARGLSAADWFMGPVWVWAQLIHSLADLGYDESMLYMAAYDWRLAARHTELRDGFLTDLKLRVEHMVARSGGDKVVMVTHSMGALMWMHFVNWVEHAGGGGATWVDEHVHAMVNIGGPLLGVPKAVSSLLSGETLDTADMNAIASLVQQRLLTHHDMLHLYRSWRSVASMLPKGGDAIWRHASPSVAAGGMLRFDGATLRREGDATADAAAAQLGNSLLGLLPNCSAPLQPLEPAMLAADALDGLMQAAGRDSQQTLQLLRAVAPRLMAAVDDEYSFGASSDAAWLDAHANDSRVWSNPLQSRLPAAPNMKIYCLYGIGKDTEVGYVYKRNPTDCHGDTPFVIDTDVHNAALNVTAGVQVGAGDGTVPLISLGYMCVRGWRSPLRNPAGLPVITREYAHSADANLMTTQQPSKVLDLLLSALQGGDLLRGGATADHVDILGNPQLLRDVLLIASGSQLQDNVQSNIAALAEAVNAEKIGGH
eukprot:PLAT15650.1.p1 GENE.PLAT15650.1~~PLAT15650.1.p1  ORF type:complete len:674 (+),score=359.21 PLAT15650.1:7-2028(+)